MSFSYSSGVITQTGTDTDLSGMVGLTGVTVEDGQYTLDNTRLVVDGTLDINRVTDRLRFINYTDLAGVLNAPLEINGTFDNSTTRLTLISSGYEFHDPIPSIEFIFDQAPGTHVTGHDHLILGDAASTVTLEGGIIFNSTDPGSSSRLMFRLNGTTVLQNCTFMNKTVYAGIVRLVYTDDSSADLTVTDCTFYGVGLRITDNTTSISGLTVYGAESPINVNTSSDIEDLQVSNFTDLGNFTAFRFADASVKHVRITNLESSRSAPLTTADVTFALTSSAANGSQLLFQNVIKFTAQDSSGVVQGAKIYATDVDNGNRAATNYGAGKAYEIATTSNIVYSGSTDASGELEFTVISGIAYIESLTEQIDNRGVSDTYDLNFKLISYNHSLSDQTPTLYGGGDKTSAFLLLTDESITQTTKATVDAYSTIDDAYEFYDRAKAYLYDNFAGETAVLMSRSGAVAECGSDNVIIDGDAAAAFAFASGSPNTFTLKSTTFTGGITTTGTVTFQDGATPSGGTFDADVEVDDNVGTITGVTVASGHTLDFTVAGTYLLTNCTINEVTNSSGGNVTIESRGSTITTNTGPNITIETYNDLTLTGLQDGTEVRVYDAGTTTEIDGVESSSGGTFTTEIAESSVDIAIHHIDYLYQRLESVAVTSDVSIPISQVSDRNYENP